MTDELPRDLDRGDLAAELAEPDAFVADSGHPYSCADAARSIGLTAHA